MSLTADNASELAAQYRHRLLSLEAALKDEARAGVFSDREVGKRVRRLADSHAQLGRLVRLASGSPADASDGRQAPPELGLPHLEGASAAESRACKEMLKARTAELTRSAKRLERVYRWMRRAATGGVWPFVAVYRLTRLRRFLAEAEREANASDERSDKLSSHVSRIGRQMRPASYKDETDNTRDIDDTGPVDVEGLVVLFTRLDRTIARVARLRHGVKREEEEIRRMQAWLTQREADIAAAKVSTPPPTPLATAKAVKSVTTELEARFARSRRRHAAAERFWDDVVSRTPSPEPSARRPRKRQEGRRGP